MSKVSWSQNKILEESFFNFEKNFMINSKLPEVFNKKNNLGFSFEEISNKNKSTKSSLYNPIKELKSQKLNNSVISHIRTFEFPSARKIQNYKEPLEMSDNYYSILNNSSDLFSVLDQERKDDKDNYFNNSLKIDLLTQKKRKKIWKNDNFLMGNSLSDNQEFNISSEYQSKKNLISQKFSNNIMEKESLTPKKPKSTFFDFKKTFDLNTNTSFFSKNKLNHYKFNKKKENNYSESKYFEKKVKKKSKFLIEAKKKIIHFVGTKEIVDGNLFLNLGKINEKLFKNIEKTDCDKFDSKNFYQTPNKFSVKIKPNGINSKIKSSPNLISFSKMNKFFAISKKKAKKAKKKRIRKIKPKTFCECEKSKCLTLHCICFANERLCSKKCKCICCENFAENCKKIKKVKEMTKKINPIAFQSKISEVIDKKTDKKVLVYDRGCECKKNECQKNYCECFRLNLPCSPICKCNGCKNSKVFLTTTQVRSVFKKIYRKKKKYIKKVE